MKNYLLIKVLFTVLIFNSLIYSQNLLFKKGDKICFIGNSITHEGEFHHNIYQFYLTRFQKQEIEFYNCGISGDVTDGIIKRMDSDILIYKPTHVIIMIGMNDVRRELYGKKMTTNADTLSQRKVAIEKYKINLSQIVKTFLDKKIKVIMQKPSIYDQTAINKTENHLGVNEALKTCAVFIQELANKNKLQVIDYWTVMTKINNEIQLKNPSATVVSEDRIHPQSTGNFIMSNEFLKTVKMPAYVSQISIKNNKVFGLKNCSVTGFSANEGNVHFTLKENALPFPITENLKEGADLIKFNQNLNIEEIKIDGLSAGDFNLVIDGKVIGNFSTEQYKKGINLALYPETPQYQQALKVKEILTEIWAKEANLRTITWVQINSYLKGYTNFSDLYATKKYLDEIYEKELKLLPWGRWYKGQFDKYITVKADEKIFETAVIKLRKKAYEAAIPVAHKYKILPLE